MFFSEMSFSETHIITILFIGGIGFNHVLFHSHTEQGFFFYNVSGVLENERESKTFKIVCCAIKDNKGFHSNIISRRAEIRALS